MIVFLFSGWFFLLFYFLLFKCVICFQIRELSSQIHEHFLFFCELFCFDWFPNSTFFQMHELFLKSTNFFESVNFFEFVNLFEIRELFLNPMNYFQIHDFSKSHKLFFEHINFCKFVNFFWNLDFLYFGLKKITFFRKVSDQPVYGGLVNRDQQTWKTRVPRSSARLLVLACPRQGARERCLPSLALKVLGRRSPGPLQYQKACYSVAPLMGRPCRARLCASLLADREAYRRLLCAAFATPCMCHF